MERPAGRVETCDPDFSRRWLREAEHHQDSRRLAGAIGAEQAEDLTRIHVEIQPIDGRKCPVHLGQAAGRDDRLLGAAARPGRA